MSVDPAVIAVEVAALLEQVDQLRAATTGSGSVVGPATSMFTSTDTDADGVPADLARLDHQADLLERAHDVLTTSLERLDRV
ncbi:hypothetical protein KIK15_18125 [Williamsia sp. CHRR-6]|nr:hypothetical protein [Williamsia sp. CHRR-6]